MTDRKKNRLEKTLPLVYGWARGDKPVTDPEFNYMDQYLNGRSELYMALNQLFSLGMSEVASSLLTIEQSVGSSIIYMSHGFSRMIHSDGISILELKQNKLTIVSSLDSVTRNMLGAVALGMPELAKKFRQVIFTALEHGYGIDNGHDDPGPNTLRYAAMGLSIIHDWLQIPLDLDKLGLPRDPAWGPLIKHWNNPDPAKLQSVLYGACDIHIERIALTEREVNTGDFEFGSEFEAVHPTEILAVLRLRDMLNLPNPELDHPLMNTPYAQITARPGQIVQPDRLLEAFLFKARERDPQIMAEWDKVQAD
ncbi:hypothetical protein K2480_002377 [Salmonella enterica]|nr:hypothetical protein [Salmonella enterica]HBZ8580250.1 hypothetical protein [Salmonella enterica subsp. houtenae]EHW4653299.1 hypothetical protein [Salmonella enterica]EIJ2977488.1 hypothetical protein [Salmonella enterica]EIL8816028.1 hypothetical protein [Salmonella enterica]